MPNEPRFLSALEEKMLRDLYPCYSTASVAQQMGLTAQQVANYAKYRKLNKSAEYVEAEKARTMARLAAAKQDAERRRLVLSDAKKAELIRMTAKPHGTAKRTAHGTAYTSGNITTHVMR